MERSVEINDTCSGSCIKPTSLPDGHTEISKWDLCMVVFAAVILMMYCVLFAASLFFTAIHPAQSLNCIIANIAASRADPPTPQGAIAIALAGEAGGAPLNCVVCPNLAGSAWEIISCSGVAKGAASKDISRTADYINKSLALIEMHLESIQVKA